MRERSYFCSNTFLSKTRETKDFSSFVSISPRFVPCRAVHTRNLAHLGRLAYRTPFSTWIPLPIRIPLSNGLLSRLGFPCALILIINLICVLRQNPPAKKTGKIVLLCCRHLRLKKLHFHLDFGAKSNKIQFFLDRLQVI
jgi:hypothetical protein